MTTLLPGFETTNGPPFGSCATELGPSDEVASVESTWFLRSRSQQTGYLRLHVLPRVEGTHSIVYVMRGPGVANRNVAAARRVGAAGCVQRLSVGESSGRLVGREPYKRQIEASSLPFPLSGVTGYGLRVRGTLAAALYHQKERPTYYEDTFGFAVGPAEIVLDTIGVDGRFPPATERRLLSLLYDRARARALS